MKEHKHTEKLMGSTFTLSVISDDATTASNYLTMGINEIKRLENLLSEFIPTSSTSKINNQAFNKWLPVDTETFHLIKRSLAISKLTYGTFDITTAPLKKLYQFNKSHQDYLPSNKTILETLQSVGFSKVQLDEESLSIKFTNKATSISFAAIGKGFAADKVMKLWKKNGLHAGYVDASGDICVTGTNAKGNPWNIGIANPDNIHESLFHLSLDNNAIATSGASEQHFIQDGKQQSHNINPHTGKPTIGIKSVTIVSPSAELCDALATSVNIMGVVDGLTFINQLPETHAIIIDHNNQVHLSKQLENETYTFNTSHESTDKLREYQTL